MPYVNAAARAKVDEMLAKVDVGSLNAGSLNYAITKLVRDWIAAWGNSLGYAELNDAIGVLECAKLELYRRVVAPYEDRKAEDNGDVYCPDIAGRDL